MGALGKKLGRVMYRMRHLGPLRYLEWNSMPLGYERTESDGWGRGNKTEEQPGPR